MILFQNAKLLKKAALFILVTAIVFSCSDKQDDIFNEKNSFVMVTVGGETINYTIESAEYSPVTRQFVLRAVEEGSNSEYFRLYIGIDDPAQLTSGAIYTACDLTVEIYHDFHYGNSVLSTTESAITLSNVEFVGGKYVIIGTGSNLNLKDNNSPSTTTIIENVEFSIAFTEISTDQLDYISYTANGVDYTYYEDDASRYAKDTFDPNIIELIVTGNVFDLSSVWLPKEGISFRIDNPTYPPVPEVVSGYIESYLFVAQNESCMNTNLTEYYNDSNSTTQNIVFEITQVDELGDNYILTGTCSADLIKDGTVSEILSLSNGSFKMTVPKL
ncbi:MAG: hypothetical protein OEW67_04335 [Cyclobacteriaceae bacterium]|nr:hypothetical protein [Cyclobacteriaceae bacterium]